MKNQKKMLKKEELRNILDQGWSQRREKSKERREKNSLASRKWQGLQRNLEENTLHMETVRRFKHYLGSPGLGPVRDM